MTSLAARRRVFVDTAAFFALADATQADHPAATRIQMRLIRERWETFTSNFVVAEIHALVLRRRGRVDAFQLLERMDRSVTSGRMNLVRVEPEDELKARDIIRQYDDKDFSLTDATSFAVMERLGIPTAFTFDRNFAQYGLDVLSPQS
jgi:predicted nucleic acid-binding protein